MTLAHLSSPCALACRGHACGRYRLHRLRVVTLPDALPRSQTLATLRSPHLRIFALFLILLVGIWSFRHPPSHHIQRLYIVPPRSGVEVCAIPPKMPLLVQTVELILHREVIEVHVDCVHSRRLLLRSNAGCLRIPLRGVQIFSLALRCDTTAQVFSQALRSLHPQFYTKKISMRQHCKLYSMILCLPWMSRLVTRALSVLMK